MRDAFGCIFPVVQEENKTQDTAEVVDFNGIHVSSNAYYGFQPLPQRDEGKVDSFEYMDVQINDCGIQFNNFINPEDRLSDLQATNITRGLENRKRRWCEDAPTTDFKKRREHEPIPVLPTMNRCVNSRQPTHNVPDIPRGLMGHFI